MTAENFIVGWLAFVVFDLKNNASMMNVLGTGLSKWSPQEKCACVCFVSSYVNGKNIYLVKKQKNLSVFLPLAGHARFHFRVTSHLCYLPCL